MRLLRKKKTIKGKKEQSDFVSRSKLSIFRDYVQMRAGSRAVCLGKGLFEPTINLSTMAVQNRVDNSLFT